MKHSRRQFLVTTATVGAVTFLPYAAHAAARASNVFPTPAGDITVHPVAHASFVMETPLGVIYCDPVGDPTHYAAFPKPDLILITHHHGDHYNVDTLNAIVGENTEIISNTKVIGMMPNELMLRTVNLENGDSMVRAGVPVQAVGAYNLTQGREKFHPQGRDNGYVLSFEGFRVYISGDTEDVPEMRALKDIDLAFVCMNLPFTMDVNAAASAVAEFAPKYVYPYHYRGKDGGTQDPAEFAKLVGKAVQVRMAPWYG